VLDDPTWEGLQLSERVSANIVKILLQLIGGVFVISVSPASADDPLAILIARARVAANYSHNYIYSIHSKGVVNVNGAEGTFELWTDSKTGRWFQRINAGPRTSARGFDGASGWFEDAKGIVLPRDAPRALAAITDYRFQITNQLYETGYGGAEVSYLGTRASSGKKYEVIAVKPKGGDPMEWWFDYTTALLARKVLTIGNRTTVSTYTSYRDVGGEMLPGAQITAIGHDFNETFEFMSFEIDPPDLDNHLRVPVSTVNDYLLRGDETRVRMNLIDGQPVVMVFVNGKGPFPFLFDSGAHNTIDLAAVSRADPKKLTGQRSVVGIGSQTQKGKYVLIDSIKLGEASLLRQYFTVTELHFAARDIMHRRDGPDEIQGIIGYEFLARFEVTFDYERGWIVLRNPPRAGTDCSRLRGFSIPILFDNTNAFVPCVIGQVSSYCGLDSGSAIGITVTKPFAVAHPEVLPQLFLGKDYLVGIGGTSPARLGKLSSFRLGSSTILGEFTAFSEADQGALADPFFGALVCKPVLKRFTITFDYPSATVCLVPNAILRER
jgi:hypothetical protein